MAGGSKKYMLRALSFSLGAAILVFASVFLIAKFLFILNPAIQATIIGALVLIPFLPLAWAHFSASYLRKQTGMTNAQLFQTNHDLNVENTKLKEEKQALTEQCSILQSQRDEYERYVSLAGTFIVVISPDLTVALANRRACQVLGFGETEIVGRSWIDTFVPEPIREESKVHFGKLLASEPGAERVWTGMIQNRDGVERIIEWRNTVLRDEGRIVGILSIGEDITDRLQSDAQSREISEKNARAQRMNALSAFSGGISKVFADMLNPVMQKTSMLMRLFDDFVPERDMNDMRDGVLSVMTAGTDMKGWVRDLALFARQERVDNTPLLLNDAVNSFLDSTTFLDIRQKFPNIEFKTDLAADLLAISASSTQLVYALENLVRHSAASMPDGGQVTIATANFYAGEDVVKYEIIPSGEYSVLWVIHSGKVIGEDQLASIFEPFGTGDQPDKAAMELSVVYGIVKAHKGYVHIKSEEDSSTEFVLCFPVCRREAETTQSLDGLPGGNESIMVVDDNEMQRSLAKRLLGKLGYKVTVAVNGRHALELMGSGGASPFDLMLLDMVMEEDFDGLDTYREVTKRFPRQKCIIVSGYAQSERSQEAGHLGAGQFLGKPYTLDSLANIVRKELDRTT